jgi:hypothetical protein
MEREEFNFLFSYHLSSIVSRGNSRGILYWYLLEGFFPEKMLAITGQYLILSLRVCGGKGGVGNKK